MTIGSTTKLSVRKPKDASAVAECAYFKAERRGFEPGFELEDWLAAEKELDDDATQLEAPPASAAGATRPRAGKRPARAKKTASLET